MKTRMAVKITALGVLIVAASYWLRGHEILTGLALSLLFLLVVFKMAFAVMARRHGGWNPDGGADSADRPESRPPGGRPPVLSATEEIRHESAA
jgi:hypothetical protein